MEDWMANGVKVGWLIDPWGSNVTVYDEGREPMTIAGALVEGTGPVEGFELNMPGVWNCYEV